RVRASETKSIEADGTSLTGPKLPMCSAGNVFGKRGSKCRLHSVVAISSLVDRQQVAASNRIGFEKHVPEFLRSNSLQVAPGQPLKNFLSLFPQESQVCKFSK